MGGWLYTPAPQQQPPTKSQIQKVDIVKVKLKQARDNINLFIKKKEKDLEAVDEKISVEVNKYQETQNKKPLIPLLKVKKDIQGMINNADVRMKLINEKLAEVELQ